eukprot:6071028-Prymnesium_polylepis.1
MQAVGVLCDGALHALDPLARDGLQLRHHVEAFVAPNLVEVEQDARLAQPASPVPRILERLAR